MIIGINGKIGAGKDTVGKIIQYLVDYHTAQYSHPITENDFNDWLKHKGNSRYWQIKKFAGKTTESYKEITGVDYHSLSRKEKDKERERYKKFAEGCKDIFDGNIWVNALMDDYHPSIGKFQWAKAIGDLHYGNGNSTYCGKPMLGNNYVIQAREEKRNICPDCYNKALPNWIITDVRFENEAQAILDKGGIIIRIEKEPDVYWGKAFTKNKEGYYIIDEHCICTITDIAIPKEHYGKVISTEEFQFKYPYSEHPSETALDNYKGFKYLIKNNSTIDDLIKAVRQILLSEQII